MDEEDLALCKVIETFRVTKIIKIKDKGKMTDLPIIEGKTIETGCKDGNHPMPLHQETIEADPMVPENLTVVPTYTDLGLLVGHQIKTDSDAIIAKNLVTSLETVYRELKMKPELETATICMF